MKAAIDVFFGLLFFFPILIWLWLHSIEHAMFSWQIKERAVESVLRSIVYPFKTVIPVAILLLLLQGVAEFLRSLFALVRGREP
jgi:TRAP-type mannitol/chloroaromatic compound transport system permease small subunit